MSRGDGLITEGKVSRTGRVFGGWRRCSRCKSRDAFSFKILRCHSSSFLRIFYFCIVILVGMT